MEAARQLLSGEGYEAVVEERALEGTCGYPPCKKPAGASTSVGASTKRWAVDARKREVFAQQDIGRFCSRECMKESKAFALRLDPDPAYVRPASAVATSRSAVATAAEHAAAADASKSAAADALSRSAVGTAAEHTAAADASKNATAGALSREAAQEDSALCRQPPEEQQDRPQDQPPPQSQEQQPQQQPQQQQQQQQKQQRNLPKVRQKAVVRFSRTKQTYSVHYSDYDGGGALPDAPGGAETMTEEPVQGAAPRAAGGKADAAREILRAPVQERLQQGPACGPDEAADSPRAAPRGDVEETGLPTDPLDEEEEGAGDNGGAAATRDDDDDDSGEEFFDTDSSYPVGWSESTFVRAWGVLTNWLSDFAREVLLGARIERSEEGRPAHKGRRSLLVELLSARIPGDLTFLAPRLYEVASALSVHQTLPSVAESPLYDLLAALVLRSIYRVEVRRGRVVDNPYCSSLLDRNVEAAARHLSISDSELQTLDGMLE